MKKLLLSVLAPLSLGAMELTQVHPSNVFVPHELGEVRLLHDKDGFSVDLGTGDYRRIAQHNLDKTIRKMSPAQIAAFQKAGYFAIKKLSDGELKLDARVRGLGGGWIGAWIGSAVGYGLVNGGVYGIASLAAVAGAVGGPVGSGMTFAAVSSALLPLAQPLALKAAMIGGTIGGVSTGLI